MPERPPFELPNLQGGRWVERERRPGEPLPPPPPPHPYANVPLMSHEARVWLSSEFVDPSGYFRFDPPVAVYEAAGWPLGVTPTGDNKDQQIAMVNMLDGHFDGDVRSALELPRRYTGLHFRPPPRRDMAKLWIRHVGRWDGEPHRLAEIVAGLARLPTQRHPSYKFHALYALTPFCIIGQTWCERDASEPAYIVDTTIAFFYTFETLIQECFISDARRAGASTADILAAYEHRYANVRSQPNLLLRDPTRLKLACYANPSIDWDSIRATPENRVGGPGWEARHSREFLFVSRLQAHLMVAIAAACQGLANFASGRAQSALVRTMDAPPGVEALAPHWLGHMTGGYDHAAECAELLQSLARYYGQDLSSDLHGMPIPPFQWPAAAPDLWPIKTPLSYLHGCTTADAYDPYRWKLFDVSLDDASVIRWNRETYDWVEKGWAAERPAGS
jgi:hypothetical protein